MIIKNLIIILLVSLVSFGCVEKRLKDMAKDQEDRGALGQSKVNENTILDSEASIENFRKSTDEFSETASNVLDKKNKRLMSNNKKIRNSTHNFKT